MNLDTQETKDKESVSKMDLLANKSMKNFIHMNVKVYINQVSDIEKSLITIAIEELIILLNGKDAQGVKLLPKKLL